MISCCCGLLCEAVCLFERRLLVLLYLGSGPEDWWAELLVQEQVAVVTIEMRQPQVSVRTFWQFLERLENLKETSRNCVQPITMLSNYWHLS